MTIKETPEAAALLDAYSEWLANERTALHRERFGDAWRETMAHVPVTPAHEFHFQWRGGCVTNPEPPSQRAASVLEHVGAKWRDTETQPEAEDGEPMAPDEIGIYVRAPKPEDEDTAQPVDVASHLSEILNLSRALELAIGGCEIPALDRDALDALAFAVTEKLETLRATLAAESP